MSFVVNVEEGSEMSVARGDKGPEPVDELGVTLKIPVRNWGNESTACAQGPHESSMHSDKRASAPQ
jgi:hypothetical protein